MKEVTLYLLLSIVTFSSQGQIAPSERRSIGEHMKHINKEWEFYESIDHSYCISFADDQERIAHHLTLVRNRLAKRDVGDLSTKVRHRREALLDSLKSYALQKRFPINNHHTERTPCFIDDFKTHCAVGHLMKVSGHGDLAQHISTEHNYDYIHDIKTAGVNEWAVDHGFTQDELAWIQPGYGTPSYTFGLGKSINGPIAGMWNDGDSLLYIAGGFSTLGNAPCGGLMTYDGEELKCLETRLKGPIYDLAMGHDGLYLVGDLSLSNVKGQLARLNKEGLVLFPSFDEGFPIGKEIYVDTSMGEDHLRVACATRKTDSIHRMYDFENNKGVLSVELFGFFSGMTKNAVAGVFDSVSISQPDGTQDRLKAVSLLLFNEEKWSSFYLEKGYLVTELEYWNGATYVFELFGFPDLRIRDDGVVDTFLHKYMLSAFIEDVEFLDNGTAVMCGFPMSTNANDTSGDVFYADENWVGSRYYSFVGALNVIKHFKGKTIVGGNFFTPEYRASTMDGTGDYIQPRIGYLVWLGGNMSVPEQKEEQLISVYPNPGKDFVTVISKGFSISNETTLLVRDITGRHLNVSSTLSEESWELDVSGLPKGQYIINLSNDEEIQTVPFVISR